MKRQNKLISLIMAVMFCITFLAPVLVAPAPAAAASAYTVLKTQTIGQLNANDPLNNVVIQLDVANTAAISNNDRVTFHLPSDLSIKGYYPETNATAALTNNPLAMVTNLYGKAGTSSDVYWQNPITPAGMNPVNAAVPSATYGGICVSAPETIDNPQITNQFTYGNGATGMEKFRATAVGTSAFEIQIINWTNGTAGQGRLMIQFNQVWLTGAIDGDMNVTVAAPANSGFSQSSFVIGKYQTGGKGTAAMAKSVVSMAADGKALDTLMIQETVKNSLASSELVRVKLPSGFVWAYTTSSQTFKIYGAWAFEAYSFAARYTINTDAGRTLEIQMPAAVATNKTSEGRIYIGYANAKVDDEAVAKKGEVQVAVSSDLGNVTAQSITVANYKDYSVEVKEGTPKEVIAGQVDTELGSFSIKEGLSGSLLNGRTISFTLPAGVKWDYTKGAPTFANHLAITDKINGGTDLTTAATVSTYDSTKRVFKFTLNAASTSALDTTFEKLKVIVSPDFTGDVVVEVGGTAGVTGKAKVATVKAPIDVTVDKTPDIIIGSQAQAIGTILIKENKAEALKASGDIIRMALPTGSKWASKGTITVSEGDLAIDKTSTDGNVLDIVLKGTSSAAATIKIEGATVTPDRTVPEGDFKIDVKAGNLGTSAAAVKNAVADYQVAELFNVSNMASVAIAKVVTPAPQQTMQNTGANGSFTVGQKFMIVAGQYKTLEVAPYIKSGRTYVPIRNLADALGATTAWDAATQKVTITKGTKTVELTIGQMTAKVNGADQAMDVAPEITGGRTMLPARYVAEGLGFTVTFDDATKQVVFSAQ